MARDQELAEEPTPTVRFFRWNPPAVSWGWKQPIPDWLAATLRSRGSIEGVERPTGGGAAFHGSDVSISVVVPRSPRVPVRALMDAICRSAARLCESYGIRAGSAPEGPSAGRIQICLTEPSPYAVFIGARKVAGFALRRYPQAWLVQGSLLVCPLPEPLAAAIPLGVQEPLQRRAIPLSDAARSPLTEHAVAERWAASWSAWWDAGMAQIDTRDVVVA